MGAVERRIAEWVDLIGDLLAQPTAAFPRRVIAEGLHRTFDCQVTWQWKDPGGGAGFEAHLPMGGWPGPALKEEMLRAMPHHPVMRWMLATGSVGPMSIGRVPRGLVTAKGRQAVADFLAPVGLEQQLAFMYRGGPAVHRAFVMSQRGADFPDDDMRVAAAVQPLLALLERQISVHGSSNMCTEASSYDLTGRELAVLRLLAQGLTAAAIGNRLAISERTVHRHLQGVYRKLGAHDRLSVVLAARDAGLLPVPAAAPSGRR
jgi:DNA-binding CsgD family transcriptional regulator